MIKNDNECIKAEGIYLDQIGPNTWAPRHEAHNGEIIERIRSGPERYGDYLVRPTQDGDRKSFVVTLGEAR